MTSSTPEVLLTLDRTAGDALGAQIQRQLREGVRSGRFRSGTRLPSTRGLAAQLGVSRPLVVEAYAQLAAEGYLTLRPGARPLVALAAASRATPLPTQPAKATAVIRFDLRPAIPDLALFPRRAWLNALRTGLAAMTADDLGYTDPQGSVRLRRILSDYLGRVRGVVADPAQVFVTSGFAEGRALACAVLHSRGVERLGVEDPSYSDWTSVTRAGLERIAIPVDDEGLDVSVLGGSTAQAILVTPAHQFPTGGVLGAGRRQRLTAWLDEGDRWALEDDYDAEFRYDQTPVGALQGLRPDRIIYAGTVSKTLAPALRLGWLVVPPPLVEAFHGELRRWSEGPPRIEQEALADFMDSGSYDRHLRKMRRIYRARRDLLVARLERDGLVIRGAAAGLHLTVELPDGANEAAVCDALRDRGVAVEAISRYRVVPGGPPTLLIGFGRASEAALHAGADALAAVLRALSPGLHHTNPDVARRTTP